MESSRSTTKLWIDHKFSPGCKIVGLLEQLEAGSTNGRSLALILHGTMGHKDYLFQKGLASALPIDSFRFDFRGNHETGGVWRMDALTEDIQDIRSVSEHLKARYGYNIALVIGHSRGSIVAMRWLCNSEEGQQVRGFVNVSGRYRMERIRDRYPVYKPFFEAQGYYEWHLSVARKEVVGRIYPKDLDSFASWDTTPVKERFPGQIHCLSIHGLKDETVPPYDALIYARILGKRFPGTHNLHMIEEADHNLTGHRNEVIDTICAWWSALEKNDLQTGVWDNERLQKGRL